MNLRIYLSLRDDQSFHTIIIKKKIGNFTYLAAVGYAGGGEYEEFYAKLYIENTKSQITHGATNIQGQFSRSTGSLEWETKLKELIFNEDTEMFDTVTEDLYEIMDENDEKIQWDLINEIKKYIYYMYDEESDTEYEYPQAKPIDKSIFSEFEDSPNTYYSTDWNSEFLEITNSHNWGLFLRFPHVIEN
jgi:hypothetical protein